jgi:hypothetical protein
MGFYGDLMVLNGDYIIFMWIIWLVVTGTMESYDFPFSWECHHPNWLIFFRGVETTNQIIVWSGNYFSILFYPFLGVTRSIWNLFVDQRRSVCCKFTEGKILGIWSQLFWDRSHKNFRVWWVESYIYIYIISISNIHWHIMVHSINWLEIEGPEAWSMLVLFSYWHVLTISLWTWIWLSRTFSTWFHWLCGIFMLIGQYKYQYLTSGLLIYIYIYICVYIYEPPQKPRQYSICIDWT